MTSESVIPVQTAIQGSGESQWIPAFAGMTMERRYEYDGLNLLRVDQRVDSDGDGEIEVGETTWRHVEVNSHRPGSLGAQLGKRAYLYASGQSTTPSSTTDYAYVYDPVGNVWVILSDDGEEVSWFSQDAFRNELSVAPFAGTSWSTARTAGITEHQTGKWIDPFTGLYYFHARWLDATVGRFVGRSTYAPDIEQRYTMTEGNPLTLADPTGRISQSPCTSCPPTVVNPEHDCTEKCSGLIGEALDDCLLEDLASIPRDPHFLQRKKVKVRFCARKLGAPATDRWAAANCPLCHVYTEVCGFDYGLFSTGGLYDLGEIRTGYEGGGGTCSTCWVWPEDALGMLIEFIVDKNDRPYYGFIGPWVNCKEYASDVARRHNVSHCGKFPWEW